MKVLMFGWEFPPVISGGLGTACHGLTKGLSMHGTEILFVIPTAEGIPDGLHVNLIGADSISAKEIPGLSVLKVNSSLAPYTGEQQYASFLDQLRSASGAGSLDLNITGKYGPDMMAEIARFSAVGAVLGRQEKFDIIHAHDWMTFIAGIEAKRESGKPLVVHVHALEFDRSGRHVNQDIYDIERRGMEEADRVIAVSHYTRNIIMKEYGIPGDKIEVIHNAVSHDGRNSTFHVHKGLDEKIVLFLGRITFQKGPDYFIEAAHRVINRIPDVRFVMAGDGDMFPRMVDRMAELRIGRYFHFTGFLQGGDVEKMYAMSDLYVMPSVSEPFGIAPLEAMLYDVPVIISKQSGVSEILDHAVKVDFWDVEKLAEEIISLLTDEKRVSEIVGKNSVQLQEIKWERAAEKVMNLYRRLTEHFKSPGALPAGS